MKFLFFLNPVIIMIITIIIVITVATVANFVSATIFNTCANNKIEIVDTNLPTTPLYFENMDNCDVIIKRTTASLIVFRAAIGSTAPISNLSVTIDDFVCGDPTGVQSCITFTKPLVDARNISIRNVRHNINIRGMTSIISTLRFYFQIAFTSSRQYGLSISDLSMSGTAQRGGELIVHTVHFDATDDIFIVDASSIIFSNIHLENFDRIISGTGKVDVAAICFSGTGKVETVPKVVFANVSVQNVNTIYTPTNAIAVSAITVRSKSFTGLSDCITSNSELKNNILPHLENNNNNNNNNNNKGLFFSSLACGLVAENIRVQDIGDISAVSRSSVTIFTIHWTSSVKNFQLVLFNNIRLHRFRFTLSSSSNIFVEIRTIDMYIKGDDLTFHGTDVEESALSNSIFKISNVFMSDQIVIKRPRSSLPVYLTLLRFALQETNAVVRYFNQIEFSNMFAHSIELQGSASADASSLLQGVFYPATTFEGCTNMADENTLDTDFRTCSFLIENVSFSEISSDVLDKDQVFITGVLSEQTSVNRFHTHRISNIFIRNASLIADAKAIFLNSNTIQGTSVSSPNKVHPKSSFVITNVHLKDVHLVYISTSVDPHAIAVELKIRDAIVAFSTVSISNVSVEDITVFGEINGGKDIIITGFRSAAQHSAVDPSVTSYLVDDILVRNVTKNKLLYGTNSLEFEIFNVVGYSLLSGSIENFGNVMISNISVISIDTSDDYIEQFNDIVVSTVSMPSSTASFSVSETSSSSSSSSFQPKFLIENVYMRDIQIRGASTLNGERRVTALYAVYLFIGFFNVTIQNIGIIGDIRLHMENVPFSLLVMSIGRSVGATAVEAQGGQDESSVDSSFTIRNICLFAAPASSLLTCNHLAIPHSSSSSSSASSMLDSIRENSNTNIPTQSSIQIRSKDASIFAVRIVGAVSYFATTLFQNIQAHHIEAIDSSLAPDSKVSIYLIQSSNPKGREAANPATALSTFTIRDLFISNVHMNASNEVKLYGIHVSTGSFDSFNNILFEKVIMNKIDVRGVGNKVDDIAEIRVCRLESQIFGRSIAPGAAGEIYNTFIQQDFFLLNTQVQIAEGGTPSILIYQATSTINDVDHLKYQNTIVENVTLLGSVVAFRLVRFSWIRHRSDRAIYSGVAEFRRTLEVSSVRLNNILLSGGDSAEARLIIPSSHFPRTDIDVFNVSYIHTNNFTATATRIAAFVIVDCHGRNIQGPPDPLPNNLPRVFTVNNIHSRNIHLYSDGSSSSADTFRPVYLVNGLKSLLTFDDDLTISNYDIFDFSNSSLIDSSCGNNGISSGTSSVPPDLRSFVSFLHIEENGKFDGSASGSAEFRAVNLHTKNVSVISAGQGALLRTVVLEQDRSSMELSDLYRFLVDNISIDNCSAIGTALESASTRDDGAIIGVLRTAMPITGVGKNGLSFEVTNIRVTNTIVSSSKRAGILIISSSNEPLQWFEHFIFKNIIIENNTVKNSVENPATTSSPYSQANTFIEVIRTQRLDLESIATGGAFLFSNVSVNRNTLSFTRTGNVYGISTLLTYFKKFHTFIIEFASIRNTNIASQGAGRLYLVATSGIISNDAKRNNDIETTTASLFKVNDCFIEDTKIVIFNVPSYLSVTSHMISISSALGFGHFQFANIHLRSMEIRLSEDTTPPSFNVASFAAVTIWNQLRSPNDDITPNSLEYYNTSIVVENISVQDLHLHYAVRTRDSSNDFTILPLSLGTGANTGCCHVSFKNILYRNIFSISFPGRPGVDVASSGFRLRGVLDLPKGIQAPPHPTTASLTWQSPSAISMGLQERSDMAFCSLEISNITLDSFNTSYHIESEDDTNSDTKRSLYKLRTVLADQGSFSDFSAVTISDITMKSVTIEDLNDVYSPNPIEFAASLVYVADGIIFSKDYASPTRTFPTVAFEQRTLSIRNLNLRGLSVGDGGNRGFSVRVSGMTLGRATVGTSVADAIAGFTSVRLSNFSASTIQLDGAIFQSGSFLTTESIIFSPTNPSCGFALVAINGRIFGSLESSSSSSSFSAENMFFDSGTIKLYSFLTSTYVLGFASTKANSELFLNFDRVTIGNFSVKPETTINVFSGVGAAIFSLLYLRGESVGTSSTSSSSSSSNFVISNIFTSSSSSMIIVTSRNSIAKACLVSIGEPGSVSSFYSVAITNIDFSPANLSVSTTRGHSQIAAVEVKGKITATTLFISDILFAAPKSDFVLSFIKVSANSFAIDAVRIGGWTTSNSTTIQNISMLSTNSGSSSLSISSSSSSSATREISAVTLTANQVMNSPSNRFSAIHTTLIHSHSSAVIHSSTINFEQSPSPPSEDREIVIQNCSLSDNSQNSLSTSALLSFSSPDADISGKWSLLGNALTTASDQSGSSSLISLVASTNTDDALFTPINYWTTFSFTENEIRQSSDSSSSSSSSSSSTTWPKIISIARDDGFSGAAVSNIDFHGTFFMMRCNHWNRAYEHQMESDLQTNRIVNSSGDNSNLMLSNARIIHFCRTETRSGTRQPTPSNSLSVDSTVTPHRTSLSPSISLEETKTSTAVATPSSSFTESSSLPLPPPPLVANFINEATKAAGNAAALLASPDTAMTMRKIIAIAQAADCGKKQDKFAADEVPDPDAISNPFSLRIGSEKLSLLRGAIVFVFAVLATFSLLVISLAFVKSRNKSNNTTFERALRHISFPGSLIIPGSSFLPVAVNASTMIAVRYSVSGDGLDILFMIIGFAVCGIAAVVALGWASYGIQKHEVLLPAGVAVKDLEKYLEEQEGAKNGNDHEAALLKKFETKNNNSKNKMTSSFSSFNLMSFLKDKVPWIAAPTRQYANTKFIQRFGKPFVYTDMPWSVPFSFLSVLIMEIIQGQTVLCQRSDRACCEGSIITMTIVAFLDVAVLVFFMRVPFLARIDRFCRPIVIIVSFVLAVMITVQFFDSTLALSEDGEDLRPVHERLDLVDTLVLLSQIAFSFAMINSIVKLSGKIMIRYFNWKEEKEKTLLREQKKREFEKEMTQKKKESEKKRKEEAHEQQMQEIRKKEKKIFDKEEKRKNSNRNQRYLDLLEDDIEDYNNNEEYMVLQDDTTALLYSPPAQAAQAAEAPKKSSSDNSNNSSPTVDPQSQQSRKKQQHRNEDTSSKEASTTHQKKRTLRKKQRSRKDDENVRIIQADSLL